MSLRLIDGRIFQARLFWKVCNQFTWPVDTSFLPAHLPLAFNFAMTQVSRTIPGWRPSFGGPVMVRMCHNPLTSSWGPNSICYSGRWLPPASCVQNCWGSMGDGKKQTNKILCCVFLMAIYSFCWRWSWAMWGLCWGHVGGGAYGSPPSTKRHWPKSRWLNSKKQNTTHKMAPCGEKENNAILAET